MTELSCVNQAEPEIHLIPKVYEGPVIIIFNEKNGLPEKYENGSRVYEIPIDGVLRTQFKQQINGYISPGKLKYYYYDNRGRTELTYLQSTQDIKDSINAYIFTKQIAKENVRYLVGNLRDGDIYFTDLQKKLHELFPPKIQKAKGN